MPRRAFALLAVSIGCSAPARDAKLAPQPANGCPASIDLGDLLARHAAAFGSEAAVLAALPRTLHGKLLINGATSPFELRIDRARHRFDFTVAGIPVGSGIDDRGAWVLDVPGVVHRLDGEEAIGARFDAWLARRGYLAIDPRSVAVSCTADGGGARVAIAAKLPELGDPELVFEPTGARLVAASHASADGRRSKVELVRWSRAEAGVSWPLAWTERPEVGSPTTVTVAAAAGIACGDCLGAPADTFTLAWPKEGVVTLPMALEGDELSLRAKVGGREVWALLDSGAGVSAVDARTPLGAAFRPRVQLEGSGSTQKLMFGLGELTDVSLGPLAMPRLPVVSVPIPALDNFGTRRPELIAGYSIFAAAAVRVDYAKSEIAIAPSGAELHGPAAVAVPIRYWTGKPMAAVDVEGERGFIEIDTGNSGGVDLFKRWASAHGFPGARKTLELSVKSGAGEGETRTVLTRIGRARLGPIEVTSSLATIADPPSGANVVGLAGNEILSRCAAVVLDVRARQLWLEPPCDRTRPESLGGWQLAHKPDPAFPDRPWIVGKMIPGSSAARAGLRSSDRLLSVGGKPATADRSSFATATAAPPGSKIDVEIARDGATEHIEMVLVRLLD